MKTLRLVLPLLLIACMAQPLHAQVPVRISIKFIVDADGNRPATGNLATDDQINAEVTAATRILSELVSEFSVDQLELVDLSGVSQWYGTPIDPQSGPDALYAAAEANPATYQWRNDAINIYINGGDGSAISYYPSGNHMILMNQGCGNTPSCVLHEMGHSLNLAHTHGDDSCSDTITDNSGWSKNQLAQNNYGCLYANCTANQRAAVDLVYNNVMSYHTDEPQNRLSPCQLDRISTQGDKDRSWLLSKQPIYVNSNVAPQLFPAGRFDNPYTSLQAALNAGGLTGNVLILQQGGYAMTQEAVTTPVDIVTRSAPSTVQRQGFKAYDLPVNLENSANPAVRKAIRLTREEDTLERKIRHEAKKREQSASTRAEKAAIRADAEQRGRPHRDRAMQALLEAEQSAQGNERISIQKQIAQRYRDAGDCTRAAEFFRKVADTTDQPLLRKEALNQIERCGKGNTAR